MIIMMLDVTDLVASDAVEGAAGAKFGSMGRAAGGADTSPGGDGPVGVTVGDEVVLPGGRSGCEVSAEALAGLSLTIPRRFVDGAAAAGPWLMAAGVQGDGGRR